MIKERKKYNFRLERLSFDFSWREFYRGKAAYEGEQRIISVHRRERRRNDDEDRSDRQVQQRQDVADQVVKALAKWLGSLLRSVSLARRYVIWARLMFLRSDSGAKPARASKIW